MEIYGQFGRFIKRNEKTGESRFSVTLNDKTHSYAICKGIVQGFPRFIPLKIEGDWEEEKDRRVFKVRKAIAFGYDSMVMGRFLYTKTFPNIGLAGAKKIMEGCKVNDLFGLVSEEDNLYAIASKINFPKDAVVNALEKLKEYTSFEKLYEYIKELGGDYYNTALLFDKYKLGSMDALRNNPYILLYSNAPLEICESLAKELQIEHFDRKRMKAIVAYCIDKDNKNGNTRISFHKLCKAVRNAEQSAGGYFTSKPLFIAEEMLSKPYYVEEREDDFYIYKREVYEAEMSIAANIARLNTSATKRLKEAVSIEEVEEICNIRYSKDQKATFKALEKSGIKIITGGPGTGKTAILKGLLYKYEADTKGTKSISLCAPTGCAAIRMQECTGRNASTIHKLLGIRPYDDILSTPAEKLDADLLVIDECSMIDTAVMARLLASVKNGATVLMIGDKDQLPSVGAGNILGDILKSNVVETYHLYSVFRQDDRSLIIENSKKIINGNARLKADESFQIEEYTDEEKLLKRASALYRKYAGDVKLYSPVKNKKYQTGTIRLNAMIQSLHKTDDDELSVSFGSYTFCKNDKVMFVRNDYAKGYYNGQEGVIKDIQDHNGKIYVCIETDNDRISLAGPELADIELAYAITAHKSQGGECKNAIIIVPSEPAGMLKRQLLYVEVTRARQTVTLLCEKGALNKAVSNKGTIYRETGLKDRLSTFVQRK